MSNQSEISPRVNSARILDYLGRTVRIIGKVIKIDGNEAIVQSSDRGEVKIILLQGKNPMSATFVEIIGVVQNDYSLKMQKCYNIGDEFDMELANFVVEKSHNPQFKRMFQ